MNFNFAEALRSLGQDAAVRVAQAARPAADYLLATFLPEQNRPTYSVESGNMTVRATMAGLVGMDSNYPPTGMVEMTRFMEQTAKIANHAYLPEKALRDLQALLRQIGDAVQGNQRLAQEALNFLNKVILQPHLDTMEWMRGQVLGRGLIDWSFNDIRLTVDYGIPAENKLPTRTTAGGTAYGAASSAWWADVRTARRLLRGGLRAILMHPDTADAIAYNDANSVRVIDRGDNSITIQRWAGENRQPTGDTNDTVRLITYDLEAEILDPSAPTVPIRVPFLSPGKVIFVGNNRRTGYRVGEGSTPDPDQDQALGYTHIAPTVEGNGAMGRWSRLYVPEGQPWSLHGQGVTNGLPVLEAPEKVVIATTELPA